MKSFLFDLREAARVCPDVLVAKLLKDAANLVRVKLDVLHADPTAENMRELNAAWVRAQKVLDMSTMSTPPESTGGRMTVERERIAA